MATTTADLLVRIDATTEQLRRELKRGETAVSQFQSKVESNLSGIDRSLGKVGQAFGQFQRALGAFGLSVGIGGLIAFGKHVLDVGDQIDELSTRLGISGETLQKYGEAAHKTGVEVDVVNSALKALQLEIGNAAAGSEKSIKKFEALGIAFENADGSARSIESVMLDLAGVVESIEDPATKAAAAAKLLGKSIGPDMVPLLNMGKQATKDYFDTLDQSSRIMSDETTKRLGELKDEIENIWKEMVTAGGEIIATLQRVRNASIQQGAEWQLERVRDDIAKQTAIIEEEKANLTDEFSAGLAAQKIKDAEARLRELQQLQRKIEAVLGIAPTSQGHGSTAKPIKPTELDLSDEDEEAKKAAAAAAKQAAAEAARNAERAAGALHDLKMKVDALTGSDTQDALAEFYDRAGSAVTPEQVETAKQYIDQLERAEIAELALAGAKEADATATREWQAEMDKGTAALEALRTPYEIYQDDLEELTRLYDEGAIPSLEAYNEAVRRTAERYTESIDKSKDATEDFKEAAQQSFEVIGTAFEDAILEGGKLRDILRGLAQDLSRIMLRIAVTQPLQNWVTGLFTAATPTSAAQGGVMTAQGMMPLRRYLGGGVAHSPQVAIFGDRPGGRGEAFVPLPDGRSIPVTMMGGGNSNAISVTNNVTVQGGTPQEAAQTGEQVSRAMTAAMEQFFDKRLAQQMQPRGMLAPATV